MAKQNLMETQSGGEGETLQATPPTTVTPEDFSVDLSPIVSNEPKAPDEILNQQPIEITESQIPEPSPVEEPVIETEPVQVLGVEPSYTGSFVDFSGGQPTIKEESLLPDNLMLIQPDIDEPAPFDFEINPSISLEVGDDEFDESDVSSQVYEGDQIVGEDEDEAEELDYSHFVISSPQPIADQVDETAVPEPFDFTDPYKSIRENTNNESHKAVNVPYTDVDVPKYKETTTNLSKSYINGYASLIGMDKLSADVLYEKNVGSESDVIQDMSDYTYIKSVNQNALSAVENAIAKNDPSILNDPDFIDNINNVNVLYGDISGKKVSLTGRDKNVESLKQIETLLKINVSRSDKFIQDLTHKKVGGWNPNAKDEYVLDTQRKAKNLKKTLVSKHGKDYGELVDWLTDEDKYVYLIDNSLKGKGEKVIPADVLAYKMKQLDGLTEKERGDIYRLSSRIYQERLSKYAEATGNADYLSYSGFNLEKKQLEKQDHQKLIKGRNEVTNTVIPKYEKIIGDWEEQNNTLFNNKVKSIVDDANRIYQDGIVAIASENPEFSNQLNEFRNRLMIASSDEEKSLISTEFQTFLESNSKSKQLIDQRKLSVDSAIGLASSEYMTAQSQFKKKVFDEAKKEFTDKWRLATYKVYKSGVNGDVNMYVSVDRVTHSGEFAKMSWSEKRKAIQDAWKKDSASLGRYLKDTQEWFPKEGEEYKPFYEWTGRREKSAQLIKEHKKQYNSRVGRQAEERYYMYGIDELLNPPDKKINTYMIKSVALDEVNKLQALIREYEEATGEKLKGPVNIGYSTDRQVVKDKVSEPKAQTSAGPQPTIMNLKFPYTEGTNANQYWLDVFDSLNAWNEVLNHDENDSDWWSDFSSGFGSKTQVPIIGSLFGLSKSTNINTAIEHYRDGSSTMAEISLVDAVASLNNLNKLNPPSRSKQIGEIVGSSTSIAVDMLLTGGVFRASSAGAGAVVDDLFTKGINIAFKADNAIGAYALETLANPNNLKRVQNVVGTVAGSLAQSAVLQGNTLEMTLERMRPEMTLAYGGGMNPLITQITNNGEEPLEAYLKSFGVNWANIAIERFAPVLGNGTLKREALQQMGSSSMLEQMVVGRWFRTQGFKSVDEASGAISKGLGWSNIVDEALVEELLLSKNIEALITGDDSLFNYSTDDVINTTLGVGLFGVPMGLAKATHMRVYNNSNNTSIETTAQDGSKVVTPVGKDAWTQFNKLLSSKETNVQKIVTFFESAKLPEDQQNALLNVYAKVKGADIRSDVSYQKAKSAYEDQMGEPVDDSFLTETEVSVFTEQDKGANQPEKTVDQMLSEAESPDTPEGEVEEITGNVTETVSDIPLETPVLDSEAGQNNLDTQETIESIIPDPEALVDNLEDQPYDLKDDIPEIEYEETVLSKLKEDVSEEEVGIPSSEQGREAIVEASVTEEDGDIEVDAGGVLQEQESEVVILPPVRNKGNTFRRMEKVDGSWKLRDGDDLVDVSESIQQEAQTAYDSEQQYISERSSQQRRTDVKTEDIFRERLERSLTNFADSIKIKTDRAYSSILPIPPKLWNSFVDVVKEGLLKGYDIGKAISNARKSVFKDSGLDKQSMDGASKMVRDYYSDYVKKTSKPTRQTQAKIDKTVGITSQPFIKIRERKILEEKIKSFNKGSKSAIKELQEIKFGVVDYAKKTLSLKDLNGTEVRSLLAQVKNAKDNKSIASALERINAIAGNQEAREKTSKINEITKKLSSAKTFVKGKGAKKKGKVSIQSVDELKEFLDNEIPNKSELESMSIDELSYISDVINGILASGRLDVKNADKLVSLNKSMDNATLIESTYQGKQTKLKSEEDIIEFMSQDEKPPVIVNGRYFSSLKDFRDYAETVEDFNGVGLEKKHLDRTRDREKDRSAISKVFKGRFINLSNVKNIISLNETLAKYPEARKWMRENVTDPLIKATNSYLNFTSEAKREIVSKQREIFGSKAKARKELNEIVPGIEKQDYGLVTKDHIVAYYCISQQPDRVDNLKRRIDLKALNEFIKKPENKNLLDYANYLMDDFLPSMKDLVAPMYEKLYDMKLPEGKYFPTFASPDSIAGQITLDDIMNPEGMNVTSAMADSLKQRVNYTGDISVSEGATRIINDYIDSIYRANLFMPVAEKVNVLLGKQNSPHLMNAVGLNNYTAIARQLSYILTGKEPSAIDSNANKLLKGITTFNAITTIGGNLASIPKQFTGVVALFGSGIKDGIYPHDVLMNTALAYTGKENLNVTKKWLTSDYIIDRYLKGGADKQFKNIMNRTNSIQQLKSQVFNSVKTGILSPVLAGDFLVASTSGSGLLLSYYKKGKAQGMTNDEAFDYAYEKTQTEFNLSQQSSASYATTETQRNRLFQLLAPFRSGQIAYANKLMSASKVLINKDKYDNNEVIQATHDLFTFAFATYLFSAVASGLVNNLFSDDEEKQGLYVYETSKQAIQGVLQGYGIGGAVVDWTLNSLSDNEWANNIPAIEAMFRLVSAPKKAVQFFEKPWDEMTDSEKKEFYKTVGVQNIIKTADAYEKYVKGEKGLYDAIMRYDPSKMSASKNDLLLKGWEKLFGTVSPPVDARISSESQDNVDGLDDFESSDMNSSVESLENFE